MINFALPLIAGVFAQRPPGQQTGAKIVSAKKDRARLRNVYRQTGDMSFSEFMADVASEARSATNSHVANSGAAASVSSSNLPKGGPLNCGACASLGAAGTKWNVRQVSRSCRGEKNTK